MYYICRLKIVFSEPIFLNHLSIKVVESAKNNNITIICILLHSSHVLQPLDVGAYGPTKAYWPKLLQLLKQLFGEAFTRSNASSGFEKFGIWPLNRNKISTEKQLLITSFIQSAVTINYFRY